MVWVYWVMRFQGVGLEMLLDGRMHPESPFNLVRVSRKQFGKQKGYSVCQISRGWGKAYKVVESTDTSLNPTSMMWMLMCFIQWTMNPTE